MRRWAAFVGSWPSRRANQLSRSLTDRLRLLDPQVAQQPIERLLVGIVLLPAEVSDETPLAEARKGWLERLLDAVRRRKHHALCQGVSAEQLGRSPVLGTYPP
jgi:hypothetical protein